ncbi:hypothetical protein QMO56_02340 [Roseomonas sp. E05]|uniref:hypothetical protein n=1 Tax=Roseomonas sp. E05 TaxID=3046310 RepID=UPI0024B9E818|nr:hypothetical protein [Roseomonas sp. E05]MDJ0386940.1 hypothetical protein [Roseomonas sp. E05]
MATPEQDALQDLAYIESEGAADMAGDFADEMGEGEEDYESFGAEDEFDPFGESEDGADGYMADAFGESEDQPLGYEDGLEAEEAEEVITRMLGQTLGAESEDEFFKGLGKFLNKAKSVVGKVARGAAPILRLIPHPAAQGAAAVANVLGKLRAEGASTGEALEAVAELAARGAPGAVPIVAGLAAREVLKGAAPRLPLAQRQQAARTLTRAATTLMRAGGPSATRALPKLVASVKRTAPANGTPPAARPKVVARAAARLAQNPQALQRLSAPSPRARELLGGVRMLAGGLGGGWGGMGGRRRRRIRIPGPATITISMG